MASEVSFVIGAATDVGKVREVNEDAFGFAHCTAGDLLLVCDGMGGHAAGDLASRTARDAILAFVLANPAASGAELLLQAAIRGHEAVRDIAAKSPERAGMGTTCVLALVQGQQAIVANVGDSRCYLVRQGQLRQISKDHTKAQQLLDGGLISAAQMATHPEKGVLSQALGQMRSVPAPFVSESFTLQVDDYLVLCSDGVFDSTEVDMPTLSEGRNPYYAADALVQQAVARDGKDNATVVIGRVLNLQGNVGAAALGGQIAIKPRPKWVLPTIGGVVGLVAGVVIGMFAGKPTAAPAAPPKESAKELVPVAGGVRPNEEPAAPEPAATVEPAKKPAVEPAKTDKKPQPPKGPTTDGVKPVKPSVSPATEKAEAKKQADSKKAEEKTKDPASGENGRGSAQSDSATPLAEVPASAGKANPPPPDAPKPVNK